MKLLSSYLKVAAAHTQSGDLMLEHARLRLASEEWGEALHSALAALETGALVDFAAAHQLIGEIYLKLGKGTEARMAFLESRRVRPEAVRNY